MSSAVLNIGELPVWRGLAESPGNYLSLPFELERKANGLLAQSLTRDIEEAVINYYADDDYGFITKPPGFSSWASDLGDQLVDFALSLIKNKRQVRVLEIGAGNLYVAERICQKADIKKYTVVDPAIREVSNDARIEVIKNYFSSALPGQYDIVLSFNCLEHIPHPEVFLSEIASLKPTKEGSLLVGLVFPDVTAQLERHDLNTFIHEHINYFTSDSVIALADSLGLSVLQLDSQQDEFKVVFEVGSASEPVTFTDAYPRFDLSVLRGVGAEHPVKLIESALDENQSVALHGACNGLNLVMHFWSHRNLERLKVFDGDSSKVGLYLPALPVPVAHSSDPKYAGVDVVLVAAVTFFDEIKRGLMMTHGIAEEKIRPLFSNPGRITHER